MITPNKLIIGPFKDMSGYATLARQYFRALCLVDKPEDWAAASVRYDSGSKTELEANLKKCHSNQLSEDIALTVQVTTPNEMRAVLGKRNIGICCWETDRIPPHWAISLNAFDAIIVPCVANKVAFERSGVSKPIHVIPLPVFREDYKTDGLTKFDIPGIDKDTTIYYNIAQWSHKKGIDAAIRSYFLAFQNNENVLLLLKGYVNMTNQQGDGQKIVSAINEIKGAMRLPRYPRIFINDVPTTEEGIKKIHLSGDCYVNFSRGEGWCIPAFESLLYGKELISTTHTAMADWVNQSNTWCVNSYEDSVHNMPHPDEQLYTAREHWFEPVIISGADAFRSHFKMLHKNSPENIESMFVKYDPVIIGQQLKDVINGKE